MTGVSLSPSGSSLRECVCVRGRSLALVEGGRPEREGGRAKTSRNRSLLPASYSHTDGPTDGRRGCGGACPHQLLPAPLPSLRPSLSDRRSGRATTADAGSGGAGKRAMGERSAARAAGRGRSVRAGAAAPSVRPSVCWSSRRRRRGCCRRRSRKKSFLQFSVRCASVAGGFVAATPRFVV